MNAISKEKKGIVLVNVISVEPDHQSHVIDMIIEASTKFTSKQPGFISSEVLKSLDGTRVLFMARWKSPEEGSAYFEYMKNALLIAKAEVKNADYHLYEIIP